MESPQNRNDSTRSGQQLLRLQIVDSSGVESRSDVHIDSNITVGQLKALHLNSDVTGGRKPRCVFHGRLLGDSETLAQLPSGSFLQCYLPKVGPNTAEVSEGSEHDLLLLAWKRLAASSRSAPFSGGKWQDYAFHSLFLLGLAVAWYFYQAEPEAFDVFGSFILRFFSLAWVLTFLIDFVWRVESPGSDSQHQCDGPSSPEVAS
eukprot:TRINITY_DN20009_c1_g1_i1.p1 TRINITY_DN20009_c1_g1~~TRINITY_DN20009_c1_g1_i1.p1  ORF type:complete len:217 (-),score=35.89 TRINITY_DN20009_c1_g1_i1:79-690(-)